MKNSSHLMLLPILMLFGCTIGPDYEKAPTSIEQQKWQTNFDSIDSFDDLEKGQSIASRSWKELYVEPELQTLID